MDYSAIPEVDKAYLAGILDGEGYITIHARKVKYGLSCQPKFVIASTSVDWLYNLRAKWGGIGCFYQRKRESFEKHNWKQSADWSVTGTTAQEILNAVLPYLQIKYMQARTVIDFQMVGQGKRRTSEELKTQVDTFNYVRQLNHRGTLEFSMIPAEDFTVVH